MDRILIELTGSLPDDNKFATLATAQSLAVAMAGELKERHQLDLTVNVRPIKESAPRAKKTTPIVAPVPMEAAPEPVVEGVATHGPRHVRAATGD